MWQKQAIMLELKCAALLRGICPHHRLILVSNKFLKTRILNQLGFRVLRYIYRVYVQSRKPACLYHIQTNEIRHDQPFFRLWGRFTIHIYLIDLRETAFMCQLNLAISILVLFCGIQSLHFLLCTSNIINIMYSWHYPVLLHELSEFCVLLCSVK